MKKIIYFIVGVLVIAALVMVFNVFKGKNEQLAPGSSTATSQTENKTTIEPKQTTEPKKNSESASSEIIIYYGDGCPHCANVEKFVEENKVEEKIAIEWKEIYTNKANAKDYLEKADKCGLPTKELPVPFLWDGSTCLIGDQAIINFLKQKI